MATFPGALKTWTALVDNTDGIIAAHPNERGDEIEVLEIKVGVTSSAVATSHDYLLRHLPGQATNWDIGSFELKAETLNLDKTDAKPITLAVEAANYKVTYLNADLVDDKHVDGSNGAGEVTTNDGTQTLTNKTFTSPDINGGTLDGVQVGGTTATGEIIVNNATDDADGLGSQGTTGQVLTSAGTGSNPTWESDSIVKAWITFTGAGAIQDGYNATVTRISTGRYTITWGTDFANTNYCVVATVERTGSQSGNATVSARATGTAEVRVTDLSATLADYDFVFVLAMGDQV